MAIADTIRAFILENFLFGDTSVELGSDASLIESDIVDSTAILELIGFIERTWGIIPADADIVPSNFDSIGRIAAYVEARMAVAATA